MKITDWNEIARATKTAATVVGTGEPPPPVVYEGVVPPKMKQATMSAPGTVRVFVCEAG